VRWKDSDRDPHGKKQQFTKVSMDKEETNPSKHWLAHCALRNNGSDNEQAWKLP
jgi:hypothetical protein